MGRYLLTGATSGVGHGLAKALVERGHHIVVLARSEARGRSTVEALGEASLVVADLCEPDSLDRVPLDELDGIVHLAGVLGLKHDPVEGVDRVWQTCYFGPIRLLERALPILSEGASIAVISGEAHRRAPVATLGASYGLRAAREVTTAKLQWVLRTAREHPHLNITSFCPGRVRSGLARGLPWWARPFANAFLATGRDPLTAGRALVPHVEGAFPSGTYTVAGQPTEPAAHVRSVVL